MFIAQSTPLFQSPVFHLAAIERMTIHLGCVYNEKIKSASRTVFYQPLEGKFLLYFLDRAHVLYPLFAYLPGATI